MKKLLKAIKKVRHPFLIKGSSCTQSNASSCVVGGNQANLG